MPFVKVVSGSNSNLMLLVLGRMISPNAYSPILFVNPYDMLEMKKSFVKISGDSVGINKLIKFLIKNKTNNEIQK